MTKNGNWLVLLVYLHNLYICTSTTSIVEFHMNQPVSWGRIESLFHVSIISCIHPDMCLYICTIYIFLSREMVFSLIIAMALYGNPPALSEKKTGWSIGNVSRCVFLSFSEIRVLTCRWLSPCRQMRLKTAPVGAI